MENSFKLIIFDLDGTLVDSSADVVECFNHALNMEGLPPAPEEDIKKTIGYPLKSVLRKYGDPEKLYRHFSSKSRQIMGRKTVLLPGVRETLEALRDKGFIISIATTKIRQNTERVLKILNIRDYVDELSCSDDVNKVKPAPDALLRLLKIYKLDSHQALMVGDTINDIISARKAGIKSAAILAGFDPKEKIEAENPDWILDDISQVVQIVSDGR